MTDDPNRIARERFTERWSPDAVHQLIKKAENTRYGGSPMGQKQQPYQPAVQRRVVGKLGFGEVENDGTVRTICKKCIHVRPSVQSGRPKGSPESWEYARCAASVTKNPSRINVITGEVAYSTEDMKYCTSLNDGYCEDYEERAFKNKSELIEKIREDLDKNYPVPKASTNTISTYMVWIKYQIGRLLDWNIKVS